MSRYQKGKTNLNFTEASDSEWQWHQLGHMQICTSLQTNNHASTPPLSFLQAGCPSCRPTNSVKVLKAYSHKHIAINCTQTHRRPTALRSHTKSLSETTTVPALSSKPDAHCCCCRLTDGHSTVTQTLLCILWRQRQKQAAVLNNYSQTPLSGYHWDLVMSIHSGGLSTYRCFDTVYQTNDINLTRLFT